MITAFITLTQTIESAFTNIKKDRNFYDKKTTVIYIILAELEDKMSKTKLQILFVMAVLLFSSCASTAYVYDGEERFYEPLGNFSIIPPGSWETWKLFGQRFDVLVGPEEWGFRPTMSFDLQTWDQPLSAAISEQILTKQKDSYQDFTIISQTEFTTAQNVNVEKLVFTAKIDKDSKLAQYTHYYIRGIGVAMTIQCTGWMQTGTPLDFADKYDSLYDRTVMSFEWQIEL